MNIESPYTNRELDEKFSDIKDSLNRIEEQTKKTNGSVARAFNEIDSLKGYKWFLMGMGAVIVTLIIPVLIVFIQSGKI